MNATCGLALRIAGAGAGALAGAAAWAQPLLGGNLQPANTIESVDFESGATTMLSGVSLYPRGLAYDHAGKRLYALSYIPFLGPGELYMVDPATGDSTFIGVVPYQNPTGLAFDDERRVLYGTDNSLDVLYRIDPGSGDVTQIGAFTGAGNVEGLAFDADSTTLYGISDSPKQLVRIDRDTAATAVVPVTMPAANLRGLAYSDSLGALFISISVSGSLYRVDDPAGSPTITEVGRIGPAGAVQGLTWIETACRPDLDGDGALTFFDFLAFQDLFAAGDLRADFTGDRVLDFFDFLAFQDAFAAGCE